MHRTSSDEALINSINILNYSERTSIKFSVFLSLSLLNLSPAPVVQSSSALVITGTVFPSFHQVSGVPFS